MKEKILFRYLGETKSIDLVTLLTTQFHYLEILREINLKLSSENEVRIEVNAFHNRSFGIEQVIELVSVGSLAFQPIFSNLDMLFSIFKDYLDIKKLLGESKPTQIIENQNGIQIVGDNNNVIVSKDALEIYQSSSSIDFGLRQSGQALISDKKIEGIEISKFDVEQELLKIDRSSFADLTKKNGYLNEIDEKIDFQNDQVLYVKKFDTEPTTRTAFTFLYKERKISGVKILDEDFLAKIKEGIRFGNGDALLVDLEIVKKKDQLIDIFIESAYRITKVKRIHRRGEMGDLFSV